MKSLERRKLAISSHSKLGTYHDIRTLGWYVDIVLDIIDHEWRLSLSAKLHHSPRSSVLCRSCQGVVIDDGAKLKLYGTSNHANGDPSPKSTIIAFKNLTFVYPSRQDTQVLNGLFLQSDRTKPYRKNLRIWQRQVNNWRTHDLILVQLPYLPRETCIEPGMHGFSGGAIPTYLSTGT